MEDELILVQKIVSGDEDAWKRFVVTYSPLLNKSIHRFVQDQELARDLYVTLLEKLKNDKLCMFSGRAKLSTWLFAVSMNHCRDYFRSIKGVRHIIKALSGLSDIDRRFFTLFYLQKLSWHEVYESIRVETGEKISHLELAECDERIRKKTAEKKLGKILERLLRPEGFDFILPKDEITKYPYLLHLFTTTPPPPDDTLALKNLEIALKNLGEALQQLPVEDRIILKLKFELKSSAREISEILNFSNEKQVYRKIDRILVRLKEMLQESGMPLEVYKGVARDIEELRSWQGSPDKSPKGFH